VTPINPRTPPTGEIVVLELHVPGPTYGSLHEAAKALEVSVERLLLMGLDHLLKQIATAKAQASASPQDLKEISHAHTSGVAPTAQRHPSIPARVRGGHRHR
jgi:hypothetical protein